MKLQLLPQASGSWVPPNPAPGHVTVQLMQDLPFLCVTFHPVVSQPSALQGALSGWLERSRMAPRVLTRSPHHTHARTARRKPGPVARAPALASTEQGFVHAPPPWTRQAVSPVLASSSPHANKMACLLVLPGQSEITCRPDAMPGC